LTVAYTSSSAGHDVQPTGVSGLLFSSTSNKGTLRSLSLCRLFMFVVHCLFAILLQNPPVRVCPRTN